MGNDTSGFDNIRYGTARYNINKYQPSGATEGITLRVESMPPGQGIQHSSSQGLDESPSA